MVPRSTPGKSSEALISLHDGRLRAPRAPPSGASPCGTFDDASVATPVFTATSAGGSCTLSVAVSDGKGGTGSGSIQFGIGDAGGVQYGAQGPVVVTLFQDTSTANPGQTVTLRIKAQDTSGGDVSFAWASSVGTLALQSSADPAHESEVQWTAPACLGAGESTHLQVTVTDLASNTLTVGFPMSGPGACMPLVGGVSTADVGATGAELVSTTTNVTLAIPAESLSTTTPISVADSGLLAPDGVAPIYDFGPPGTIFAHPITVRVPLPAGATEGNVYWRRHDVNGNPAVDGDGNPVFDNVGGVVQDGYVVAQITHFSEAYVGPVATARTVSGSSVTTYAGASRPIINVPSDYSAPGAAPAALYLSGGSYVEVPGTGSTDGTFVIPDVPNGEYVLRLGTRYVVTSNDSIDLGSHRNGRPDTTPIGPNPTVLTMNFTNASPYADSDLFELVSADSNQCVFDFTGHSIGSPGLVGGGANVGDTTFSMSIDFVDNQWCGRNAGLIQGSQGDSAVVGQLVQVTTDTGMPVQLMQQIATLPTFDQVEGSETVVDVALQTLPQGRTANYTILGSEFTRFLLDGSGQVLPNVVPTNAEISPYMFGNYTPFVDIEGMGGGNGHGMIGNTLDLALVSPGWGAGDFATGTLSYGVPPDGNWGVFTGVRYSLAGMVKLPCPDATGCQPDGHAWPALVRTAGMERQFETALQPTGTVAPLLSPVSAAFVNGASLATRQTGFGTTPTLSWTPPTLGAPDLYRVSVYQLWTQRGPTGEWETWWNTVASISTPHTSVVVPPGILVAGQPYMFAIQALQTEMANPLQAPNRQATNNSWTAILTDVQYP